MLPSAAAKGPPRGPASASRSGAATRACAGAVVHDGPGDHPGRRRGAAGREARRGRARARGSRASPRRRSASPARTSCSLLGGGRAAGLRGRALGLLRAGGDLQPDRRRAPRRGRRPASRSTRSTRPLTLRMNPPTHRCCPWPARSSNPARCPRPSPRGGRGGRGGRSLRGSGRSLFEPVGCSLGARSSDDANPSSPRRPGRCELSAAAARKRDALAPATPDAA